MQNSQQKRLRYVIIGAASGIFNSYRTALQQPEVELVAISDINEELGRQRADEFGCSFYVNYQQMLAETSSDLAIVLTPPFLHATHVIDCLRAGRHVLVEKPMALQVADADAMITVAREEQHHLGVVLQHRLRPEVIAARKLLQEGTLGTIQRVELTSVWPRPGAYFQLAPWRATWNGEGGGVLLNQGAHHLDLVCHLLGSPRRVAGWTRTRLQQIETEDTCQVMLEWQNGALGSAHVTTAEADVAELLKIVGTAGKIELAQGSLVLQALARDMRTYIAQEREAYATPAFAAPVVLEQGTQAGGHLAVVQRFHDAIVSNSNEYSDGAQGRMELELANAIIYSSHQHAEVELPLDPQSYATFLAQQQAKSRYQPRL